MVPESLAIESGARVAPFATDDNATVLVVDDDDDVRAVARDVLREHGYRVLEARTGEEATQLSAAYASTIHVVVSDVILPGMNGPDLVTRLQRSRPGLWALFISGTAISPSSTTGFSTARRSCIEKPFSSEQLLAYVRAALTGIAASTRIDN